MPGTSMRSDRPQWERGLKLGFDTLETGVVSKKEWGRNRGNHLGAEYKSCGIESGFFFFFLVWENREVETCFN